MDKKTALTFEQINEKLKELPGWVYADDKIRKEFKFKDFLGLLGFIQLIAPFFEANDHHPDMHIYFNKIVFELQRFDIGGKVTEMDFIVAREIENEFGKR